MEESLTRARSTGMDAVDFRVSTDFVDGRRRRAVLSLLTSYSAISCTSSLRLSKGVASSLEFWKRLPILPRRSQVSSVLRGGSAHSDRYTLSKDPMLLGLLGAQSGC